LQHKVICMKESNSYYAHLSEMKELMDKSSRFISLSGLSGVLAGIYALFGAYAARSHIKFHGSRYAEEYGEKILPYFYENIGFYEFFIWDAAIVVTLSLLTGVLLTAFKAKKKGQRIWDRVALRMLINMGFPIVVGGLFCLFLLHYGHIELLAPSMLIFYGFGLINGSKYTLGEIKYLGVLEVLLGLLAMFKLGNGLYFWAVGFGIMHILYGTYMWFKYDRE
jgi:hypothetical protein